ncbi:hypothetical protein [Shewanella sp. GXUN23E]|uniref:hypothetical protein n=1 Tax=Shewanella sp. GXUN23E TaxID=3422498 RepID=UPI003D7C9470
MHIRTILPVLLLLVGGCSSVPSVKLTPESFNQLQTARLESAPDNNLMLQAISTVDVVPTGVGTGVTGSAGDGRGVRTFALQFMDRHQISLNELVRTQFEEKLRADNLALRITDGSPNRLVLTLNVVVLGMNETWSF